MRIYKLLLLIPLLSLLGATGKINVAEHKKQIEDWRAKRYERLRSVDGLLTLIGLFWLHEGENPFGSDPSNKLVFPASKAPAHAGSLKMQKGKVILSVRPGVTINSKGKPLQSAELKPDTSGDPTILDLGSLRFFVIERNGKLGVRLRDREHPARKSFQGIDSYPIDPKWRMPMSL